MEKMDPPAGNVFAESRYELAERDREHYTFLERPRPLASDSGHKECTHTNTGYERLDCLIARGLLPSRAQMEPAVTRTRAARWKVPGRPAKTP